MASSHTLLTDNDNKDIDDTHERKGTKVAQTIIPDRNDEDDDDDSPFPANTHTFSIPQDHDLLLAYGVYHPTLAGFKKLKSEEGRTIFAEAFIENIKLGTLSDLCVRVLAQKYGDSNKPDVIKQNPLMHRIHYDSLSIDLPLEECYHITDQLYWRRSVLAKTKDKCMAFKKLDEFNWKNYGVSLKYVEIVEACSAEYWPDEEMERLAHKVKEFITEMHISRLQSLQDRAFEKYFDSGSESESESILNEESSVISQTTSSDTAPEDDEQADEGKTEQEKEYERQEAEMIALRKAERKAQREARRKQHAIRREKRLRLQLKLHPPEPEPLPKKKKKKKKKIESVFDISIEESDPESQLNIPDHRNVERALHRLKKYKYPPEHCHHIDLSFIRHFDLMVEFTLEFLGPILGRNFHKRHLNFSYDDIERLGTGLCTLKLLKVFRLRNSRMDARKMDILVPALQVLPALEIVDFGNCCLLDDCGPALYRIFIDTASIKSLELEGNDLGQKSLLGMANGIRKYQGKLEYLGLARNPLTDKGLELLAGALIDAEQVSNLNLTAIRISDEGIVDIIADDLLQNHEILERIDLAAIPMECATGVKLINALENNKSVLHMDCRCCNLAADIEADILTLVKRNRYIHDHPYIGDPTKTEEDIEEFHKNIQSPILVHAMEKVQKRMECLARQEEEENMSILAEEDGLLQPKENLVQPQEATSEDASELDYISLLAIDNFADLPKEPFVYDTSTFTAKQIKEHINVPGPNERYFYFKKLRRRALYKD